MKQMTLSEMTAIHNSLSDAGSSVDRFEMFRLAKTAIDLYDDKITALGKLAEARDIIESLHDRGDVCEGCRSGLLDVAELVIDAIDELKQ